MKQAKDYIIFPLDFPSLKAAQQYVELLSGMVGMFKVGLELFVHSGVEIIRLIQDTGSAKVFLDLKLHDIPVTVGRAMERIADLGVEFTTVHCAESPRMIEAAVAAGRGRVDVLGVTILTSVSKEDIRLAGFEQKFFVDLSRLVMKRAAMAKAAGCRGVVCSGLEVAMLKQNLGKDFVAVTPGIRAAWDNVGKDDQQRVTTPARAVQNGADYLVVGRPIRDAADPREAAERIAREIETVL